MKTLTVVVGLVGLVGLAAVAGCASLSPATTACGDPCASLSCPSAFACMVDARCVARCQPEPVKPGTP